MASKAHLVEQEANVREVIKDVPLPVGVTLKRIETGEDHTGDPAMWLIFGVSKSKPLTKKRIGDLVRLKLAVADRILATGDPRWPYNRFVDVK